MRSFGGGSSSSRSMGGGSGGASGGGSIQMLRNIQRAVRAGTNVGGGGAAQEPFSQTHTHPSTTSSRSSRGARQSTYNNNKNQPLTLSSSYSTASSALFPPYNNLLPTAAAAPPAWPSSSYPSPALTDESDWECVDYCYDDFVFGTVPSKEEVHHAVFALQEVIDPASSKYLISERPAYNLDVEIGDQVSSTTNPLHRSSSSETKLDWLEPSLHLCNQNRLQAHERVYDAFHLLQNEPSVQRMVISLSSDKAVWDAVLNNEIVQELRESLNQDMNPLEKSDDSSDASDPARDFLSWIIANSKAKLVELVDKITKLVNEFFRIEEGERRADSKADPFEEKLRASFLLSVVVMLIVVLTRSTKA